MSDSPLYYVEGLDFVESTLTLTGSVPVEMATDSTSTSIQTKWATIRIYPGSKLLFTGSDITLIQQHQDPGASRGGINGIDGTVEFTAEGGTVTLENPGIRSDGSIHVGSHLLKLRNDQSWLNPSGFGYIRMQAAEGVNYMEAIDGSTITSLSNIPLVISYNDSYKSTLSGGRYRGLNLTGTNSSRKLGRLSLAGDVELTGEGVIPGNDSDQSAATDTGISLRTNGGDMLYYAVVTEGYDLTMAHGLFLYCDIDNGNQYTTDSGSRIEALTTDGRTSTVTIGGDVFHDSLDADTKPGSAYPIRRIGLEGDALTVFRLNGNYYNLMASMWSNGLSKSTLNMVGADSTKTMEVMGNVDYGFAAGSATIGCFDVGNGTDATTVQLVNQNRNDGGIDWQTEEALMVRNLRVRAGSTLDCNIAGGGGVAIAPVEGAKGQIRKGSATEWAARTGILTITTKYGSFQIDTATINTHTEMSDAINAHTAEFGVEADLPVWYANMTVSTTGNDHDDFLLMTAPEGSEILWENSVFVTQVNGRAAGDLVIEETARIDLNTGLVLSPHQIIDGFVGMGDQTATWNAVAAGVIDSGNPTAEFEAVAIDIADYEINPEAEPIYITKWKVSGGEYDPIDAVITIDPDFVYQNNQTTQYRHNATLSVVVNNLIGSETYTVTISDMTDDTMFTVEAGASDLEKLLVGGTRDVDPIGDCNFTVTVTDSLGRASSPVNLTLTVRDLGDVDGNGDVEPTDKTALNNKINGINVLGHHKAFDIDGNGDIEPTDKTLLNNILNGVTVN